MRPLICPQVATAVLDISERDLRHLLDEGKILWAFDIASPKARRSCLRILTECVWHYARGKTFEADFEKVCRMIVPGSTGITASSLANAFGCTGDHSHALIRSGVLRVIQKPQAAKSSPIVSRESVCRFLRSRRVT